MRQIGLNPRTLTPAGMQVWKRTAHGSAVLIAGKSYPCCREQPSDKKTGDDIFSRIGLAAYTEATDPAIFNVDPSVPMPALGDTLTWEGKDFTFIYSSWDVDGGVNLGLLLYAYYAGPVVMVSVSQPHQIRDGGAGYKTTRLPIAGSPFPARVYRLRVTNEAYQLLAPGVTTVDKARVVAFINNAASPAPPLGLGWIVTMPGGEEGRIMRVRPYADRVDVDLLTGLDFAPVQDEADSASGDAVDAAPVVPIASPTLDIADSASADVVDFAPIAPPAAPQVDIADSSSADVTG